MVKKNNKRISLQINNFYNKYFKEFSNTNFNKLFEKNKKNKNKNKNKIKIKKINYFYKPLQIESSLSYSNLKNINITDFSSIFNFTNKNLNYMDYKKAFKQKLSKNLFK
jgi:hypothetical protein